MASDSNTPGYESPAVDEEQREADAAFERRTGARVIHVSAPSVLPEVEVDLGKALIDARTETRKRRTVTKAAPAEEQAKPAETPSIKEAQLDAPIVASAPVEEVAPIPPLVEEPVKEKVEELPVPSLRKLSIKKVATLDWFDVLIRDKVKPAT